MLVSPATSNAPASDEALFAVLVADSGPQLLRYLARHTAIPEEAHDLRQITFMEAWRNWHACRNPADRQAWLFGIAAKVVAGSRRRAVPTHVPLEIVVEQLMAPPQTDPDYALCAVENRLHLLTCLDRLPTKQREAVLACRPGGLSPEQFAAGTGQSRDSIYKLLERGRKQLRAWYYAY